MNKYLKSFLYVFGIILIFNFLITLLNYIGIISGLPLTILKIIIPFIALFMGGVIMGKNSETKGWLSGIKIGLISILLFLLISLIFNFKINIFTIIYYFLLLFISTFGGIIGINKKLSEN